MGDFKWLHLSDLHFRECEGFDMNLIIDRLKTVLRKETEDQGFRYIFLTGDLADRSDYSAVEPRIKELLLDSGIMEEGGRVFWACGNHDIPSRKKRIRKQVIEEIRDRKKTDKTFEYEFADEESREVLLGVFDEYYKKRKSLFHMEPEEYPHQVIHTDDLEIVMLNTCLTSCDDEDEHKLYLREAGLIKLFHEIEPGKPIFVMGHHSLNYLADADGGKLLSLFQEKNVSLYLCGHSHRLGVRPLSETMQEIVSGGFKEDGYAVISFFTGVYRESEGTYQLFPYTYRSGSMNWAIDYQAVSGMEEGKTYQAALIRKGGEEELSDLTIRCQKLFQEISNGKEANIDRLNQIGERLLRKYIAAFPGIDCPKQMKFHELCELAIQNGNKRINYSSLRLTETMRDIWRFRGNFIRVLHELGKDNLTIPVVKEKFFDYNDFYDAADELRVMENAYVLVIDAIHDIDMDKRKLLGEFPWDVIVDYDGYSQTGGFRGCVSRQNIRDVIGKYQVVRETILRRGITSWIRVGEQMQFALDGHESGIDLNMMKDLFRELIRKLYENTNGKVFFIFMKDLDLWDYKLMETAWERFENRARFIMAGAYNGRKLTPKLEERFLDSRGKAVKDCYEIFETSATQFIKNFCEHSDDYLGNRNYEVMNLPTSNGLAKLDQNLFVNLGDFFQVLVSEIGTDLKHQKEEVEAFYLGGEAAWSLFHTRTVLGLLEKEVEEDLVNRLKTALGAKKEQPGDAIFYLLHNAGFGGTTVSKGIAWRMHFDYPTLILINYEYGKIRPLIQSLYDNHSRKGIFIVADENRFSVSDLKSLEQELCGVDRPFALLIVRRLERGKNKAKIKNAVKLNTLKKNTVNSLRTRFMQQSRLSDSEREEKDERFEEVFSKNNGMRCPFLIGLYYQDKQFNGVTEYVDRIVRKVHSKAELRLLLVLAVINFYGRIGVVKELVKKYVALLPDEDYLVKYPYAAEVFIGAYDETLEVWLYREKHPLLSEEIMKQCSVKVFNAGFQEKLKDVSQELIDKILEINKSGINLYYKNLLERLFIYKNATDVDEKGNTDVTEFSPLILALPSQASKEEVMCTLAEKTYDAVGSLPVAGNELYYRMGAHVCGHLGRLYKASMESLKLMENSDKSVDWCKKAEEIMRRGRFEDAYIYHMHGTSLSKQCQDKIKAWEDEVESCSDKDLEDLERNLKEAVEKFDETVYAGEIIRGRISKLSLLMEYMQFLMKHKGIQGKDSKEIQSLSDRERGYLRVIEELISTLEEAELDDKDQNRLSNLKNKYRAEIMFNDFGKAIEYYTNAISNTIKTKGEDAEELYGLRSGLAGAILGKYNQEGQDPYEKMEEEDRDRILEALEKNIFSTVVISDRWEKQSRCNDCRRWLMLAKQNSVPVQKGISVAEKWKELQKQVGIKDPRPSYYLAVLHYLNVLDGYPSSLNIAQVNQKESYKIAVSNSSFRIVNKEKIRDILLDEKKMGRLWRAADLSETLDRHGKKLVKLRGKFDDIESERIGIIKVVYPQAFKGLRIPFKMGDKNTIGPNQTTHMLEFGIGFTFERLEAINSTVKDVTEREM